MRQIAFGLPIRLVLFIAILECSTSAQEIVGFSGQKVTDGRVELTWFIERINEVELRHDDDSRDYYFYVAHESIDQRAAVKFDSLKPPLFIQSVKAFVYEYDIFPELPGGALSPFNLAVLDNQDNHPGETIAGQFESQAEGYWADGGEWVEVDIDHILAEKDIFWAEFSWLDSTPSAPILGLDLSATSGTSIVGYDDNGMNWQYWESGNIMIRADITENDRTNDLVMDSSTFMPDSCRIYASSYAYPEQLDSLYRMTIIDSLHCDVYLAGVDNYFIVTSYHGGQESSVSEIIYVQGEETIEADVTLSTELIELQMISEDDTSISVTVSNQNGSDLGFKVRDILEEMPGYLYPISIMATPSDGILASAVIDTIDLLITTGQIEAGEYRIPLTIDFWDNTRQYKDKQIEIVLNIDQVTSVEDDQSIYPGKFELHQNYPNPFNAITAIRYNVPVRRDDLYLDFYNILGKLVISVDLSSRVDGFYIWDGRDKLGNTVSSGIYVYKLRGYPENYTKKLVFLK
jgi:hypothetical protein